MNLARTYLSHLVSDSIARKNKQSKAVAQDIKTIAVDSAFTLRTPAGFITWYSSESELSQVH